MAKKKAAPVERCAGCGCTEDAACDDGCSWATAGICSKCYTIARRVLQKIHQNFQDDAWPIRL